MAAVPRFWRTGRNPNGKIALMNKDRIEGAAKQATGKIKETVGHAVGDAKLESDGAVEKATGKVQNAVGGLKDALKK
jgi:uncharacterized protein YjbJ (UPF0337 family)